LLPELGYSVHVGKSVAVVGDSVAALAHARLFSTLSRDAIALSMC
jgi:hypothetical protein